MTLDSGTISVIAAAVIAVAGSKVWDAAVAYFQQRSKTPVSILPPGNGFSRDDHAKLAVIEDKLERMEGMAVKLEHVDVTLGKLDLVVGRLAMAIEMSNIFNTRPPGP